MAFNAVVPQHNNLSLRTLSTVPTEIWIHILNYVSDDEDTLEAVVGADCPASDEAERLLWNEVTPENGKLTRLYHDIEYDQQVLAGYIRSLTLQFEAPGEQLATCALAFSSLRELKIVHNEKHQNAFNYTHASIRTLISPSLLHLEIGSDEYESSECKPRVNDFFAALTQCANLHTLKIRACLRGSIRGLVQVLQSCRALRNLTLDKHTAPLINHSTIKAIAMHPNLASLKVDKPISMALVSPISGLDAPFPSLTSLDITVQDDAAVALLSHARQLRYLRLAVHKTASIFPVLRRLSLLEHLELDFEDFSMTSHHYNQLVYLSHLEQLELGGMEDRPGLDMTVVDDLSLVGVLTQLPNLQALRVAAEHKFDEDFLIALGRRCVKLVCLALSGEYKLAALCQEAGVLFPRLVFLELGDVVKRPRWGYESEE